MSPINKAVFRIIGLYILLLSSLFLSTYIFGFRKITTVQSFMQNITILGLICIGFYGGLQLLKLRKSGHRLLTIWLLCQIFTIFFVFPAAVSRLFSSDNFPVIVPATFVKSLITASYLLYPPTLIYLLVGKTAKESLMEDNPRHIRILATFLFLLTPGLARALLGNLLAGMVLFFSYWSLIAGPATWEVGPESLDRILKFLSYPAGWAILAAIDWYAVREFELSERIKNSPAPDFAPKQVNGA